MCIFFCPIYNVFGPSLQPKLMPRVPQQTAVCSCTAPQLEAY